MNLTADFVDSIKSAARKLTGWRRRELQAEMALKHCDGSPRRAEQAFGWGRAAVATGLGERRTGIRCRDDFQKRGRKKSEALAPPLAQDIEALVAPSSQADPKFQTPLAFTRITAAAVGQALAAKPRPYPLPARRTLNDILNRRGYRLRRVLKTRPKKKSPRPTRSSPTSTPRTPAAPPTRLVCGSPSTPRPR